MIKYNLIMCCYDKNLVNVAAYVIPGSVCVCVCDTMIYFTFQINSILTMESFAIPYIVPVRFMIKCELRSVGFSILIMK
jgi:hypothetical protein